MMQKTSATEVITVNQVRALRFGSPGRTAIRRTGATLGAAMLFLARLAGAQDVTAAATAFTAGQQAELNREWARAAEFYELADQIAPNAAALRSAAKSRLAAGDRATAATEAEELLRRYPEEAASTSLAKGILEQASPRLARFDVQCKPSCTVGVDRAAVSTEPRAEHIVYVDPGEHRVEAFFAGSKNASRTVTGVEGQSTKLAFEPPAKTGAVDMSAAIASNPSAADRRSETSNGLPPAVAITGMAVTAVLGGITLWSGLNTLQTHSDLPVPYSPSDYDDGVAREHRTNWLIGATAVVGTATLAVSLFGTRWGAGAGKSQGAAHPPISVAAGPQGGSVMWQGAF